MKTPSDRWKQLEERVTSESARIGKAQESAFEELSERLSERIHAALNSTETAMEETLAGLTDKLRAQIERDSERQRLAVETSMAAVAKEQRQWLALWSKTGTALVIWVALVVVLGLATWQLGARSAQKWKEVQLLEAMYESESKGLALMREHSVAYQADERGLWIRVHPEVTTRPGLNGQSHWILLAAR